MQQHSAPLVAALRRYLRRSPAVFHVPGHLQGAGADAAWRRLIGPQALSVDLTEAPGLDDLHAPAGPIAAAQALAAAACGAGRTFFLVGGSTVGIQAALLATAGPEDTVVVPRHAHRSVIGGLMLSGARPAYVFPRYDPDLEVPLGIDPADVTAILPTLTRPRAMVAVHPTYFGLTGDLRSLAAIAHNSGMAVIADEAHGAHFGFHPHLPAAALRLGADVAIQSLHKTGGSLTQSSMLHVAAGGCIDAEACAHWLRVLQSSSPSYLLMASLDAARRQLACQGERRWSRALELAAEARDGIARLPGLRCLEVTPTLTGAGGVVVGQDRTRLLIDVRGRGVSGYQAARRLWSVGVAVELAGPGYVLALVTPYHRRCDLTRLLAALAGLKGHRRPVQMGIPPRPEVVLTPAQAMGRPLRRVELAAARGEVAAETVAPYPPGVPVLVPGERVTAAVLDYIRRARRAGAHFQGPGDPTLGTIAVVKE